MKFEHRFQVNASQQEVAEFHSHTTGFKALVPPFTPAVIHSAPDPLVEGSILDFTLWAGPIPIRWESVIQDVSVEGFTDIQGQYGPYRAWTHRHNFIRVEDNITEVYDHVEASFRPHLLWGPVALGMWISLPLLFAYRKMQTIRHLEEKAS